METKVMSWIADNFHLEKMTIKDFPLFPAGKRVIDVKNEEMLVYYDFLHEKIVYIFPEKGVM